MKEYKKRAKQVISNIDVLHYLGRKIDKNITM